MNATRRFTWLFARILALSLMLLSCREKPRPVPAVEDQYDPPPATKNPKIGIFIDGSGSMIGYVRTGNASKYASVIQSLRAATPLGSRPGIFWFDESIRPMGGYPHAALLPGSYKGQHSNIGDPIGRSLGYDVTVIVTDLFETSGDIDVLIRSLEDMAISRGRAIGVIGVQSAFDGHIYHWGANLGRWPVKGPHPFYVLLIGNHRDVVNYCMSLSNLVGGLPQFVLLSPFIVDSQRVAPNLAYIGRVRPPYTSQGSTTGAYKLKRLRSSAVRASETLAPRIPIRQIPNTVTITSLDPHEIRASVLAGPRFVPSRKYGSAFIVSSATFRENLLTFNLSFPTTGLPRDSLYRIEVVFPINAGTSRFDGPTSWVATWDANMAGGVDGTKTPYLQRFVRGLAAKYRPILARFYVDIST